MPKYQDRRISRGISRGGRRSISRRGFASMDPRRQREIASKGGRAAHQQGTAHEFTTSEARAAGRKGGRARARLNRAGRSGRTGRSGR